MTRPISLQGTNPLYMLSLPRPHIPSQQPCQKKSRHYNIEPFQTGNKEAMHREADDKIACQWHSHPETRHQMGKDKYTLPSKRNCNHSCKKMVVHERLLRLLLPFLRVARRCPSHLLRMWGTMRESKRAPQSNQLKSLRVLRAMR